MMVQLRISVYYWDYYDDPIWFLKKQSELKHKLLGLVITQLILKYGIVFAAALHLQSLNFQNESGF